MGLFGYDPSHRLPGIYRFWMLTIDCSPGFLPVSQKKATLHGKGTTVGERSEATGRVFEHCLKRDFSHRGCP